MTTDKSSRRPRGRRGAVADDFHGEPTMTMRSQTAAGWRRLAALCSVAALLATACGGVGTGGTGSFAMGPITGFGSVIVNGIAFDDGAAQIEDDEGLPLVREALRLGMVVEIDAGPVDANAAAATRIRVGSELRGEIESVDWALRRFKVLGQTVQVDADTLFGDDLLLGPLSLRPGKLVEVHGQVDADGPVWRATRIDGRLAVLSYKLRAPVAAVDVLARTLRVGSETYSWEGALSVPADPASLGWVRMLLRKDRDALGQWQILAFAQALPAVPADLGTISLKGLITQFTSPASFRVNGAAVDASAAEFPDGSAGLRRGVRVVVAGSAVAGTLVASRVGIETDAQRQARGFTLLGELSALDAAAQTFVLRQVPVYFGRSDLVWVGGGAADLRNGRRILVQGLASADGTRIEAVRIEFP